MENHKVEVGSSEADGNFPNTQCRSVIWNVEVTPPIPTEEGNEYRERIAKYGDGMVRCKVSVNRDSTVFEISGNESRVVKKIANLLGNLLIAAYSDLT